MKCIIDIRTIKEESDMYKQQQAPESEIHFSGIKTFMKLPHTKALANNDYAIIGIPFDTGQSFRAGARMGPNHIRNFGSSLEQFNMKHDIDLFEYTSGIDYGDIDVFPGNIHRTYDKIVQDLMPVIENNVIPIILGGDHSITLANLRAIAKKHGPVSFVLFDSHTDTWDTLFDEKYTHGTPFRRAVEEGLIATGNSVMIGMRGTSHSAQLLNETRAFGFKVITMNDVRDIGYEQVVKEIYKTVGNEKVFISFDIDFLDPVFAPGTGTPEAGGASTIEGMELVQNLDGLNIVGFDLVEVLPAYDSGEVTAIAAANIVFEMISLFAVKNRRATLE